MTIWPVEDGRDDLEARFQGASGYERAETITRNCCVVVCGVAFGRSLMAVGRCVSGRWLPAQVSTALGAFAY